MESCKAWLPFLEPWVVGCRGEGGFFAIFNKWVGLFSVLLCFNEKKSSNLMVFITVQRTAHRLGPCGGITTADASRNQRKRKSGAVWGLQHRADADGVQRTSAWGRLQRITCDSTLLYVMPCIMPCPPPPTVVLLCRLLSLRSTELVNLSEAGSASDGGDNKGGRTMMSPRRPTRTPC